MEKTAVQFFTGDLIHVKRFEHRWIDSAWARVVFIDNDGTLIGVIERTYWRNENYKKGEHVRFSTDEVYDVFREGQKFCYSDDISICGCVGLCRNK